MKYHDNKGDNLTNVFTMTCARNDADAMTTCGIGSREGLGSDRPVLMFPQELSDFSDASTVCLHEELQGLRETG